MASSRGRPLPYFARLIRALTGDQEQLAKHLGITMSEMTALSKGSRKQLVDLDRDEMWFLLDELVSSRIGELISIREELSRKLAVDRRARMERMARITQR